MFECMQGTNREHNKHNLNLGGIKMDNFVFSDFCVKQTNEIRFLEVGLAAVIF